MTTRLSSSNTLMTFISFMVLSSLESALPVIEVMVNDRAYLPCNFSSLGNVDDITLVLWFRDNETQPLYSLDSRNGHIRQGKRFSSSELGKRGYFFLNSEPPSLRIDPIELSDTGEYRCRIDSRKSRTMNIDMKVQVIVPPTKPSIKNKYGQSVQGLSGPYNEGDPLVLVCEAIGGKPLPNLTWWRDSTLIDDSFRVLSGETVRNDLVISSLERTYLHAKLECLAINNNLIPPPAATTILNVNFKPLLVEMSRILSLSAGKEYNISCKVTGSRPRVKITWWIGSTRLGNKEESITTPGLVHNGYLRFTPESYDNGKFFSCRAENPLISDSALEDGVKLIVHYKPELTLTINGGTVTEPLVQGSEVYLECSIEANPKVSSVLWKYEGNYVKLRITPQVMITNRTLIIKSISRMEQGEYSCEASNIEGKAESNVIELRVLHAPMCKEPKEIVFGSGRNREARLECQVIAEPQEVAFNWWFNNTADGIFKRMKTFSTEGTKSELIFTPRTNSDYGYFYCSASNRIGTQQEPCVFRVISIAGAPEAVKNCTLSSRSEESLHLECNVGYDGGATQYFVMEVYNADTDLLITNVTSPTPSLEATNLPSAVPLLLVVYAVNSKGRSPSLSLHSNTVVVSTNESAFLRVITPALAIIIGIVAGLVLVTFVVLLAVKHRCCAKRNRQSKIMNEVVDKNAEEISEAHDSTENSEGKSPDIIPSNRKIVNVNVIHREDLETATKCSNNVPESIHRGGDMVNTISHRDWGPSPNQTRKNIGYQELAVIYPTYDTSEEPLLCCRTDIISSPVAPQGSTTTYSFISDNNTNSCIPRQPLRNVTFASTVPEINVIQQSSDDGTSNMCCTNQKLNCRGIESTV